MIASALAPFDYAYMTTAIQMAGLVGGLCAFLSAYLMLKGWSLIGDALAHSVVPGVAGAYMLGLPFVLGAFVSGGLAACAMLFLSEKSGLKTDVIIGVIFTSFFGLGLFAISISPIPIDVNSIIMGNILAIAPADQVQIWGISIITLMVMAFLWRDMMLVFFDEDHARSVGLSPPLLKVIFFTLLSASVVAAMQAVGAFLVIAMVITPGATAYLLCDRFSRLLMVSVAIGCVTSMVGAWGSYFLNGATGGIIVSLQAAVFVAAFVFAPKHGRLAVRRRIRGQGKTP